MKKILIRSGISPIQKVNVKSILNRNLIGGNSGNLIYAYGLYRTLMTSDDVDFIPDCYRHRMCDVDQYNEECDKYIIAFADMFRQEEVDNMEEMATFIERLKIPCIITGVGIRASLDADIKKGYPFDDTVKKLLNAVLDKSAIIGVRGEMTGEYLKSLGYIEGKHYMVIGCPSMYGFGKTLKRREIKIPDINSALSVNMSVMAPAKTVDFLTNILKEYPKSYFLPQRQAEFWTLYTGVPYTHKRECPSYPTHITDPIYQEDRVKFFLHARAWIDFLSKMDFSIGSRIHGNIAAIQAGTPCLIIPHDLRMKELVDYHKLPHVMATEINENCTLEQLIEQTDFDSMYKCHSENFDRYISFLEQNDIDHIFKESADGPENAPLDKAVSQKSIPGSIPSIIHLSTEEMAVRWKGIYRNNKRFLNDKCDEWKQRYQKEVSSSITTKVIKKLKRKFK